MKIILKINIYSDIRLEGFTYHKVYESNIVPRIGEKIQDDLFAELKLVMDVIHNFNLSETTIMLPRKKMPDDRLNGHIQEVAQMHNWIQKEDEDKTKEK